MDLIRRINNKTARVGVIGMGYVGLPLLRDLCRAGFKVTGFDIDNQKIEKLNAGKSYIKHIPAKMIASLVKSGRFQATANVKQNRDKIVKA